MLLASDEPQAEDNIITCETHSTCIKYLLLSLSYGNSPSSNNFTLLTLSPFHHLLVPALQLG